MNLDGDPLDASLGFLIELRWTTPGDDDETDVGAGRGSDLDLHLLNPNGRWGDLDWDCHWASKNPNWGQPGDRDDPFQTIDDTDGAGPEEISYPFPVGVEDDPLTFTVGVHHFSDKGYGPSDATVRISIRDELVREMTLEEFQDRQFWEVARIEWPSGLIEEVDRVFDQLPD